VNACRTGSCSNCKSFSHTSRLTNTSHLRKTRPIKEMRISTRCATRRTLRSSLTQTEEMLTKSSSRPLFSPLPSYQQHSPFEVSSGTEDANLLSPQRQSLDLLPSLQTQVMSARLLKRSPLFPPSFPPHNLRSFSGTCALSSTLSLSSRTKAAHQVAQPT
jgi:hypothetical protein